MTSDHPHFKVVKRADVGTAEEWFARIVGLSDLLNRVPLNEE